MLAMRKRPYSLADFKADTPAQPQVRKEFPDAIYWVADVVTDARGEASVQVTYPDALTTWRLTARGATADTRVGQAVARTTVTKDLIVRVITPRFLTEGDDVRRRRSSPTTTCRASGRSTSRSPPPGWRRPARPTRRVSWSRRAASARLDWRFTAGTAGRATRDGHGHTERGSRRGRARPSRCCRSGLKREAGASGSLAVAGTATATLAIPAHSNPAARTIEIGLAPSLAGSMLGALDFLTGYPYGCTEQTLSSFLPNLVVARTLAQLEAHADRAAVAARSPGDRGRDAAARLPA